MRRNGESFDEDGGANGRVLVESVPEGFDTWGVGGCWVMSVLDVDSAAIWNPIDGCKRFPDGWDVIEMECE